MKYFGTALCALLASTAYAQDAAEDAAGTETSAVARPKFTVSSQIRDSIHR